MPSSPTAPRSSRNRSQRPGFERLALPTRRCGDLVLWIDEPSFDHLSNAGPEFIATLQMRDA
jgi:hypothetical protein